MRKSRYFSALVALVAALTLGSTISAAPAEAAVTDCGPAFRLLDTIPMRKAGGQSHLTGLPRIGQLNLYEYIYGGTYCAIVFKLETTAGTPSYTMAHVDVGYGSRWATDEGNYVSYAGPVKSTRVWTWNTCAVAAGEMHWQGVRYEARREWCPVG